MEAFDLKKALAGEPILTRDHQKGYVKFTIEENFKVNRLVGIINNGSIIEVGKWLPSGNVLSDDITPNDIIGMWEEQHPRVQLRLPCPLKEVKNGTTVYYISINTDPLGVAYSEIVVDQTVFDEENHYHKTYLDGGFYFTTKEEAQEWLDAMRNARR